MDGCLRCTCTHTVSATASRCHARAATRRTNDLCPTTLPPLFAVHPRLRRMYSQQRQVNACRDESSTGSAGVCRYSVAGRRGHSHPQTPVNCDNSTGFIGSMNLIAPTCHTQVHLQHPRGSIVRILRREQNISASLGTFCASLFCSSICARVHSSISPRCRCGVARSGAVQPQWSHLTGCCWRPTTAT